MLIILMRHAEREYRPDREEAEQVLTPKGRETADRLGQLLADRLKSEGRTVSRLLTSSYARAYQTAALVAPHLGIPAEQIIPLAVLQAEPDGSVGESFAPVIQNASQGVVVAGHGPDLMALCYRLCGRQIELKKACALAIEWDDQARDGQFLWQISHKDKPD